MKWLMQYLGKKAQENMQGRGFNGAGFNNPQEEPVSGSERVSVKKTKSQKSPTKSFDNVGDYVDFEEVE
jgi:hypothetical protein